MSYSRIYYSNKKTSSGHIYQLMGGLGDDGLNVEGIGSGGGSPSKTTYIAQRSSKKWEIIIVHLNKIMTLFVSTSANCPQEWILFLTIVYEGEFFQSHL